MRVPTKIKKLIKENRRFLLVSHVNPDADAIGSCIALAFGLKKLGKHVYILSKDPLPDFLKFLPGADLVKTRIPPMNFDVMLIIDCTSLKRTGFPSPGRSDRGGKTLTAKTTAVIDHHLASCEDCGYSWIIPDASATAELIFRLLKSLHISIGKKTAVNLYAAIFMDTGGFRYSSTNVESMRIASELIESGANTWEIAKELYENISLNSLKLLTLSLLTLEKKGKISSLVVTRNMLKKTNTSAQDTENFSDYPRKVKGVEVGVLFREDAINKFKISFRSKGKVNVADIARSFGGGGHAGAAGCSVKGSLKEVKDKVLRAVQKAISKNKK